MIIRFEIRPAVDVYEKNVGSSCLDRRCPHKYKGQTRREGNELEGACPRRDVGGRHQIMFCFQAPSKNAGIRIEYRKKRRVR
jgi:hypothetical protein